MDLAEDRAAIAKLATAKPRRAAARGPLVDWEAPGPNALVAKEAGESMSARGIVPIAKANDERQTVTGVVLQPEEVDGHGDIMSADVIADAAHKFLANINVNTKMGLQHKDFKGGRFALVESYLAPIDLVIGDKIVKVGSWIMTVKVLDGKIWQAIKDGKVTGFSIGGVAKVQPLKK